MANHLVRMPVIILHLFQALDGFLLVVTQGGTILFASESVTSLLNHLPVSLNDAFRKKQLLSRQIKVESFVGLYRHIKINE